jgi:polar amino acid transport system substrate-binding protein
LLAAHGYNSSHFINQATLAELAEMLRDEEIDLWATGDLTGRYEMQKAGVVHNAYKIVFVLSSNDFYFIFSRDVSDAHWPVPKFI